MDDNALLQYKKMTETPIPKLVLSLGIPTIISMLVTSIYNIGDTYFVSKLGTSVSGAVGVIFPIMTIIQAVGFTIGMGCGSLISRLLGKRKDEEANIIAMSAIIAGFFLGLLITVFGLLFLDSMLNLFGATKTIFPYAKSYGFIILFGAPIMCLSFILNNILRAEGKARFSMIGLTTGGILNLLLDPLFIFTFDMGIKGAAIATLISQAVGLSILLGCFLLNKSIIKIKFSYISKSFTVYFDILKVGFPSLVRQGMASAATILLNAQAKPFGDPAIAAMSIVGKIFMLIFAVSLGIGQGYQPVAGYNYSSKKYKRVRQAFIFTFIAGTICLSILSIVCFIFSNNLINLFISDDYMVVDIGSMALKAQCLALPFIALGVVCNMTFQSLGKKSLAVILSAARQGIFFIPLILILPHFIGLKGIQFCQALSDGLTFLFTIPFAIWFLKSINQLDKKQNSTLNKDDSL